MSLHDVLRPIPGPEGQPIQPGQTVDVSDWRPRNVKQLVERRYLRPAMMQGPVISPVAPSTGRARSTRE